MSRHRQVLSRAQSRIKENTLLILDLSDLKKSISKNVENEEIASSSSISA
jgi:hypothetical protein